MADFLSQDVVAELRRLGARPTEQPVPMAEPPEMDEAEEPAEGEGPGESPPPSYRYLLQFAWPEDTEYVLLDADNPESPQLWQVCFGAPHLGVYHLPDGQDLLLFGASAEGWLFAFRAADPEPADPQVFVFDPEEPFDPEFSREGPLSYLLSRVEPDEDSEELLGEY